MTGPIDKNTGVHDDILVISEATGADVLLVDLDPATIKESRESPGTPGLALRGSDLYEWRGPAGAAS